MSKKPGSRGASKEPGSQQGTRMAAMSQRASNEPGSQQETMQAAGEPARSQGANKATGSWHGASNEPEIQKGAREAAMSQRAGKEPGTK